MEMPAVRNTVVDPENKVTYHVMAYRQLSRVEMLTAVRLFHAQPNMRRRKKPLKNTTITFLTLHGASPNL